MIESREPKYKRDLTYLFFVLPGLIIYTLGMVLPFLWGIGYSLTDWDGISETYRLIGIDNYLEIFTDPQVLHSFWFTLKFAFFNIIIQNSLALVVAVYLDEKIKSKKLIRTMLYLPALLSPILVGAIWKWLFIEIMPLLNSLCNTNFNFSFLTNPNTVLYGLLVIDNWQWLGYWMMVYLVVLQTIPVELYEAVEVDGGGFGKKFSQVTLPMIMPAITICTIGIGASSFKLFDLVVSTTQGGPGHASESMLWLIYQTAFADGRPGYASAISFSFWIFLLSLLLLQLKYFREKELRF